MRPAWRPGVREGRATGTDPPTPGGRVAREGLGEAEVEHLDLAVRRDLDVGGLEVAVDDALLVGFLERLGDLLRDGERLVDRESRPRFSRSARSSPGTSSIARKWPAEPSGSVAFSKP